MKQIIACKILKTVENLKKWKKMPFWSRDAMLIKGRHISQKEPRRGYPLPFETEVGA